MYRALTRDIEVTVEPYYLADQSDPDDSRYVWGYRVVISNHSDIAVRLVLPGRDLKLGVVMALIGAPVFLQLIWRQRRGR